MNDRIEPKRVRALGLCSGGLDSILSALVLRRQGVHVEWVTFETPFFASRKARQASEHVGVPLHVREITTDYLKMLTNPPAGYGKNMNPCLDCHALMFKKAGELMRELNFDFLFSGEVRGQRPMSQNANALRYVAKNSGFGDHILRPLSALCLPATPMEQNGLVDRRQLLDFSGRSRKPQIAWAQEMGITRYPAPAGGCLLTDKGFSGRLKDLFDHHSGYAVSDLHLLKHGRHMRLTPQAKIVVGRTQQDNERIMRHCDARKDVVIRGKDYPGPTVVLPGGAPQAVRLLAGAICAGYGKSPQSATVRVEVTQAGETETISVLPIPPGDARRYLIR